jgi:hypothetical protein
MPTVRKKFMKQKKERPKKDSSVLTEARYHWLISEMPDFIGNENPFSSQQDEEICYRANKDTILERWLSDPHNYCRRPKCFLQFEDLPSRQIVGQEKWFNPMDHDRGEWEVSPILESDHQWLNRLGLLEEKEVNKYHELEVEERKARTQMKELGLFLPVETITN